MLFRHSRCIVSIVDDAGMNPVGKKDLERLSDALEAQWGASSILLMIISTQVFDLRSDNFHNFVTLNYVMGEGDPGCF